MTDVNEQLRRFIEGFESGERTDPWPLLAELEGTERAELAAMIEGYLELAAPAREWDPDAFEGSISERAVARVAEQWSEAAGELPHLLVELRNERRLKRSELVAKLAKWLDLSAQAEEVARYYHRLEHGWLRSEWISPKVFDALGSILETSAETLRRAGGSVAPSAGGEPGPVYARATAPAPENEEQDDLAEKSSEETEEKPESEWDEVDRLFLGGARD